MTLNGVMALFCVISVNSGSFRAHCVKVHVHVFGPSLGKFECQGQMSRSPGTKNALCISITPLAVYRWYALTANNVMQQQMGPFHRCLGVIWTACVCFIFW